MWNNEEHHNRNYLISCASEGLPRSELEEVAEPWRAAEGLGYSLVGVFHTGYSVCAPGTVGTIGELEDLPH